MGGGAGIAADDMEVVADVRVPLRLVAVVLAMDTRSEEVGDPVAHTHAVVEEVPVVAIHNGAAEGLAAAVDAEEAGLHCKAAKG